MVVRFETTVLYSFIPLVTNNFACVLILLAARVPASCASSSLQLRLASTGDKNMIILECLRVIEYSVVSPPTLNQLPLMAV